jgi:hypothetical protein
MAASPRSGIDGGDASRQTRQDRPGGGDPARRRIREPVVEPVVADGGGGQRVRREMGVPVLDGEGIQCVIPAAGR